MANTEMTLRVPRQKSKTAEQPQQVFMFDLASYV